MFESILVAVDGSKHSDAAFDIAVEMARKFSSNLFVLNVFPGATGHGLLVSGVEEDTFMAAGQLILDSYEKKIKKLDLPKVRMLLAKGEVAQKILETAGEVKCGLIVLGKRGKRGLAEPLLGSVSHKVTSHAECPVLVAR